MDRFEITAPEADTAKPDISPVSIDVVHPPLAEEGAPSLRSGPSNPDLAAIAFERASGELQQLMATLEQMLPEADRRAVTKASAKLVGAAYLLGQLRGEATAQAEFESVKATVARQAQAAARPRCPVCAAAASRGIRPLGDIAGLNHPTGAELEQMPATTLRAALQTYHATGGNHVERMRATVAALTAFIGRESDREHQQAIAAFALGWQAERDEIEQWLHRMGIDASEVRAPGGRLDLSRIEEVFNARQSRHRMT